MSTQTRKSGKQLLLALTFLAPNIVGVLAFTIFPVFFSLVMAFTNWDLRRHNMFKDEPLAFVGLENFVRLFTEPEFFRYLGNTLFLMMGIPFSVAGSLAAAMLLSKDLRGGGKIYAALIASGVFIASTTMLTVLGMGATSMVILLSGVACGILLMGLSGRLTVYRTLFYTPHFVQGVPTFLLWKKLYKPETGPINAALRPVLDGIGQIVSALPALLVRSGLWLCLAMMVGLLAWGLGKLRRFWRDGELGTRAALLPLAFLLLPTLIALQWSQTSEMVAWPLMLAAAGLLAWQGARIFRAGRDFTCAPSEGFGSAAMLALGVMVAQFVLLGLAPVFDHLPAMVAGRGAADTPGLSPPDWIHSYHWAKPSLMIMGLWAAIGSNNMILYLAALTNVPQDLYDAADIDGASRMQKFWNVTWPQLAPTTFFIVVMSTIHGLQGGFEMARTMTEGGPAGATTTLSYFIYTEGFQTGRLSFSSAVAWTLFVMIFLLTLFNWRFGNRYVNE